MTFRLKQVLPKPVFFDFLSVSQTTHGTFLDNMALPNGHEELGP